MAELLKPARHHFKDLQVVIDDGGDPTIGLVEPGSLPRSVVSALAASFADCFSHRMQWFLPSMTPQILLDSLPVFALPPTDKMQWREFDLT